MAYKTVDFLPDQDFGIIYDFDEHPREIEFRLHNHQDVYELVLLLHGDCIFYVEGNAYLMHPQDIVITRPLEFHHIEPLSDIPYERIIIYIQREYFKRHNCEHFKTVFDDRLLGNSNLITNHNNTRRHTLISCIQNLSYFASKKEYYVADSALIEMLYWLNQKNSFSQNLPIKDSRIHNLILYINEHLTEDIELDTLAEKFFTSKYYLCRLFKANTGYTINQYINQKRIFIASDLHKNGETWLSASLNAGFRDYSHFYRMYKKQMGISPRS